ncbi:MAG: polysaccharide deacetylase, partial [Candidatus Hodarchaeota archaeon]
DGIDNIERKAELGTPIYSFKPRMAGVKRYFDDEYLRKKCIEFVQNNNGKDFFESANWRKKISLVVQDYITNYGLNDHYETDGQMEEKIYKDLYESKRIIEEKLPGKVVQHLAYPYFVGSEISVQISIKAGYRSNFWGIIPYRRRTNRQGNDPYRVVRLREEYIYRLPGQGRKPLVKVLEEIFLMNYERIVRKLIQKD